MDEFEKRLKQDADAIRVEASPELAARIDASLQGIEPIRPVEQRPASANLWWASSLTGLAAAIAVVVVINWDRPNVEVVPEVAEEIRTVPPDDILEAELPDWDIRTVEFASPLEEELVHLKSDLEKAREKVRQDLDFTF
jgi:hypothetical protein